LLPHAAERRDFNASAHSNGNKRNGYPVPRLLRFGQYFLRGWRMYELNFMLAFMFFAGHVELFQFQPNVDRSQNSQENKIGRWVVALLSVV
jgi:hypothetical protein